MTSISALNTALPISGLEPQTVAYVRGLVRKADGKEGENIEFLEPPAGQHVPYVDPVKAMSAIFLHRGLSEDIAAFCAETEYGELRIRLALLERVRFYDDDDPNSPECVPAPLLMEFLRERRLAPDDLVDYLEKVIAAVTVAPIFQGPENWKECWSLAQLPEYKSPESMIEFFPGAPWGESSAEWRNGRFPRWRKEMRVVAADLQKVLGESVYHFSNPDSDVDDDNVHRFLVLHLCCTLRPESLYVQFLLEASGAESVAEFMAAMVNPENYAEPFKIEDAFIGLESKPCRLDYTPLTPRQTVCVAFETMAARRWAESLLLQHAHSYALIVAPEELIEDEWLKSATKNSQGWNVKHFPQEISIEWQNILSAMDKVCVVTNEKVSWRWKELDISDPLKNLILQAHELRIPLECFHIDGWQIADPLLELRD